MVPVLVTQYRIQTHFVAEKTASTSYVKIYLMQHSKPNTGKDKAMILGASPTKPIQSGKLRKKSFKATYVYRILLYIVCTVFFHKHDVYFDLIIFFINQYFCKKTIPLFCLKNIFICFYLFGGGLGYYQAKFKKKNFIINLYRFWKTESIQPTVIDYLRIVRSMHTARKDFHQFLRPIALAV